MRLQGNRGITLVELITVMVVLSILAAVAMPMYRVSAKRAKEIELRRDLRMMRDAIDAYKKLTDEGRVPKEAGGTGYPKTLEALTQLLTITNTAPLPGQTAALPGKIRLMRKIPVDPMTGGSEWGMRSNEDDPESATWGGQDVFDVYSLSDGTALDGTKYRDW